ncbi:MAG: AI-2E family transporter, partial [Planctomycetota bacterium]
MARGAAFNPGASIPRRSARAPRPAAPRILARIAGNPAPVRSRTVNSPRRGSRSSWSRRAVPPSWKSSRLLTLAAVVVVVAALYFARGVLIPFALALLVSFLLTPLVTRLQRWRFPRVLAVVTAVLLVTVAAGSTSWLVVGQVRDVTSSLTEYRQNVRGKLATLHGAFARPVEKALKTVESFEADLAPAPQPSGAAVQPVRIVEPARGPLEVLFDASRPAVGMLLTAALVLLFAFMMLLRRDDLGDRFIRIMGSGQILVTTRALEEAGQKVSSYLWRLLLLNGLQGFAVALGLLWIGVPNALLWGLLSAILRFIPYLGPWVAAAFPVLTSLAVSAGWSQPLITIGMFVFLELLSNNVLEPWIHGKGTGISPLALLGSTLFWTWLWGPVGLVLA